MVGAALQARELTAHPRHKQARAVRPDTGAASQYSTALLHIPPQGTPTALHPIALSPFDQTHRLSYPARLNAIHCTVLLRHAHSAAQKVSHAPFGVKRLMDGGLKGYCKQRVRAKGCGLPCTLNSTFNCDSCPGTGLGHHAHMQACCTSINLAVMLPQWLLFCRLG